MNTKTLNLVKDCYASFARSNYAIFGIDKNEKHQMPEKLAEKLTMLLTLNGGPGSRVEKISSDIALEASKYIDQDSAQWFADYSNIYLGDFYTISKNFIIDGKDLRATAPEMLDRNKGNDSVFANVLSSLTAHEIVENPQKNSDTALNFLKATSVINDSLFKKSVELVLSEELPDRSIENFKDNLIKHSVNICNHERIEFLKNLSSEQLKVKGGLKL